MQRLDLKTVRYDKYTKCVLLDGRKITLAVTHEALEAIGNKELDDKSAMRLAIDEVKTLTRLAEIVPADDGLVTITKNRLLNDGVFDAPQQDSQHAR